MGEYIKYKGNEVKIGTLENLYYTSYQKYNRALKEGMLSGLDDNGQPEEYVKPDSGFRFRFPFPDEDKLPFGDIGQTHYLRGVRVKIDPIGKQDQEEEWKMIAGKNRQLEITQQKLIHREEDGKACLALIVRNPESGLSFRIEDEQSAKIIVKGVLHNHVANAANLKERTFYRQLAARIIAGYRLNKAVGKSIKRPKGKPFRPGRRKRGLR